MRKRSETPGEEHARREGERERAEKDEPGALERSIERRIDSSICRASVRAGAKAENTAVAESFGCT